MQCVRSFRMLTVAAFRGPLSTKGTIELCPQLREGMEGAVVCTQSHSASIDTHTHALTRHTPASFSLLSLLSSA